MSLKYEPASVPQVPKEVEDELEWAEHDYRNMKDQAEKTTLNEKVPAPPLVELSDTKFYEP